MIIRKNATKESVEYEIEILKECIRRQKEFLHKLEIEQKKRIRTEQRELDAYVKRLAEMKVLIKTK